MRRCLFSLITLVLGVCMVSIGLSSCGGKGAMLRDQQFEAWSAENGKLKVLCTTAMIHDIVRRVGGEHVDSLPLITGSLDPHSYELVKGDDEKLAAAQLIFYNGLGLEHGPSLRHHLQTSKKAIPLGDRLREQHLELILSVGGQIDPHIWMDISLWEKTVETIVTQLSVSDSAHASDYQKQGELLRIDMKEAHVKVRNELQTIPSAKRFLVTSHDAFNYFARAYLAEEGEMGSDLWQRRFAAPEGLAPEGQLSVTDIQNIIDHLHKYQITVLFTESNLSRDSIKKIVDAGKKKGLDLKIATESLYGDAMGEPGSEGDTYLKMIQHNASIIAHNLR